MRPRLLLFAFVLTVSPGTGFGIAGGWSAPPLVADAAEATPQTFATSGTPAAKPDASAPTSALSSEIKIPGPLRSFLRIAGISQKASPDEVLPLLAHEVRVRGYDHGHPTEFLVLVKRYLDRKS